MKWMLCALASAVLADQSGEVPHDRRVRSDNVAIMTLLESGARDSPTFRQLVLAIEGTDGVVYVQPGSCPGSHIKGCLLHTMTAAGERRYLWIAIGLNDQPINLMVTIAHELRHALEILSVKSIRTAGGIFFYYHSRGGPRIRVFETAAALATEAAVRRELTAPTTTVSRARR
jgi:hypothetical protein